MTLDLDVLNYETEIKQIENLIESPVNPEHVLFLSDKFTEYSTKNKSLSSFLKYYVPDINELLSLLILQKDLFKQNVKTYYQIVDILVYNFFHKEQIFLNVFDSIGTKLPDKIIERLAISESSSFVMKNAEKLKRLSLPNIFDSCFSEFTMPFDYMGVNPDNLPSKLNKNLRKITNYSSAKKLDSVWEKKKLEGTTCNATFTEFQKIFNSFLNNKGRALYTFVKQKDILIGVLKYVDVPKLLFLDSFVDAEDKIISYKGLVANISIEHNFLVKTHNDLFNYTNCHKFNVIDIQSNNLSFYPKVEINDNTRRNYSLNNIIKNIDSFKEKAELLIQQKGVHVFEYK